MTAVSYDDLVGAATVGLDHRPLSVSALVGPAADHAAALDPSDPAAAALDAAALLTAARRAGVLASPAPGPVSLAPPDTAPELPPRAAALLLRVLDGPPVPLVTDLLGAAAEAGYRLPAPQLPTLLDVGGRDATVRPAIAAVLGARGHWLAAQRPDWQRVADAGSGHDIAAPGATEPDVWETGSRGARRAHLAALRGRDPDAARDLLDESWSQQTGDDRADLLLVLAAGLSPADEAFLEAALDDRKGSVRAAARTLLARLPDSAYAARTRARAEPLLRVERRALRRRLVVVLPETCDTAAVRDGVEPTPPSPVIGLGTWLLTGSVAAAPLSTWTAGLDAAELAALPVEGGFATSVHAGWRRAAVRERNEAWAAALLSVGPGLRRGSMQEGPGDPELAAVLPHDARIRRLLGLLARHDADAAAAELVACRGPWPAELADAVLRHVAGALRRHQPPHTLHDVIHHAGLSLPTASGHDYGTDLRMLADAVPQDSPWPPPLSRAADTVDLRRHFLEELR